MERGRPLSDLGIHPAARKRAWVPVLMYHAIDDGPSIISIRPALFAWQMHWLHENGYDVISLSRLVQSLRSGTPLPARSIVITFDDGFESVYTHAFPVLARYGFPATVFLVTGHCGQQNNWPNQPTSVPYQSLLTWAQIREMDGHGIEFGAHSISHPRLDRIPAKQVSHEILGSKAYLKDHLGHPVELFAYPYGRYNEQVKATVGRAYTGACTAQLNLVTRKSDPLALARIDAHYVQHPRIFRNLSTPLFPIYIHLRRPLRTFASFILRRPWR
jgi:peptidoglycan/xylan/chitin deacetylase (PgdA/CDA1 family)